MIAQELLEADSVLIFPHILMDGDAMGSAAALCKALRAMDKDAYIVIEDKVPDYLMFLDHGYTVDVENIGAADIGDVDVSICVDCGEKTRFPKRAELFYHGLDDALHVVSAHVCRRGLHGPYPILPWYRDHSSCNPRSANRILGRG